MRSCSAQHTLVTTPQKDQSRSECQQSITLIPIALRLLEAGAPLAPSGDSNVVVVSDGPYRLLAHVGPPLSSGSSGREIDDESSFAGRANLARLKVETKRIGWMKHGRVSGTEDGAFQGGGKRDASAGI